MFKLFMKSMFRLDGWKIDKSHTILTEVRRSVIIAAPHTSNWDFINVLAAFEILKMPIRFTIKNNWLRFPFNLIMNPLGAIPIDMRPKLGHKRKTMVDAMIELFEKNKELILLITPEGSRKKTTRWKEGFYRVAMGAQVPILTGYLDYKKKLGGIHSIVHPTGDYKKDMLPVMDFYKNVSGRYPEEFSVDQKVYD